MNIEILLATPPRFVECGTESVLAGERFERVAVLEAPGVLDEKAALEWAFAATQNIDAPWRPDQPCRSSSCGDVFVVHRVDGSRAAFEIAWVGFQPVVLLEQHVAPPRML